MSSDLPQPAHSDTQAVTAVAAAGRSVVLPEPPEAHGPTVLGVAPASLFRTSSLAALSVGARLVSGFAVTKVAAVVVGPSGLALLGQMGNFAAVLSTFSSGGITTGITKYLAEVRADANASARILATALRIALVTAAVLAVLCAAASSWLAQQLLQDSGLAGVFVAMALATVAFAVNGLVAAALNGQGRIGQYTALNLLLSVVGLAITLALIFAYGLVGALYSFAAVQLAGVGVSLRFAKRAGWWSTKREVFDAAIGKRLARFSVMAVTTAITLPFSHLVIRDYLGRTFSWEAAGQWQAVWHISDGYLLLITMTLSIYYLPRLSELQDAGELRNEIRRGFRVWVPFASIAALSIFLLRDWVIYLLFAPDFLPMRELFAFQLIGDVLKIASWLLSYMMVAKAMTGRYVVTEIVFTASFIVLVYLLTQRYGLVGVTYAFAANYLLYFATMAWLFRREVALEWPL